MIGHDDRRNFYRMMINAEVSLRRAGSPVPVIGICQDLSATGLGISLGEPLAVGEVVQAKLSSQNNGVPPLQAEGKVIRCEQSGPGDYQIGIEITQMN
ncbi:PilZ domain-containing protein [Pokkaliibacter sp. CJK22405]|uniref:PilZ domain-containing protein n=1 Tax=Pokkaliibacter sp. CJK22405 TaxID=3384615 RepID=UPI003985422D